MSAYCPPRGFAHADAQEATRPQSSSTSVHSEHSSHSRSRSSAQVGTPKRLSVFTGRSRSNTTSSTRTLEVARNSPSPSPTTHGPGAEREKTKSMLFRSSRILRRQGSKFAIAATLEEHVDDDNKSAKSDRVGALHRGVNKLRRNQSGEYICLAACRRSAFFFVSS